MKEDFKDPKRMSFKDYLAVVFSGSYLAMLWAHFIAGIGDKDTLSLLNTNIGIILTGYFVHEITRMGADAYREKKNGTKYPKYPGSSNEKQY